MARLYVLLFLVQIVLAVCALISCLSADEEKVKALPRMIWVLIILFFPLVGSIAWFLVGRERPAGTVGVTGTTSPAAPARRPLAPDDDPEFLASLNERSRREDQERLRLWEEDLRRREEELRGRPDDRDRPEV
ncbi:PLD nuclease N-terminal domain-containing protein [Micromonospora tulbaghiae]|uniref:PLDc_N domain-containing protein n=1 Tax=Micromonospora tulbaghiae TaxID=479978 RepID=A0AAW4JEY9_9ACTN|nr:MULTISPECIES: PLD nuclease N-terminal domain-containing protein [Micromonospora]KAB1907933.1 PLDc_N domain-containing protein [Micromonospora sp. AMSO1212t]MBO4140403.1 PLDc_N domain-containing protein [Micromonospora tulbaghiae]MDX5459418.1 PLD nuclease N-terminal domain-containing protein [Micromonospora tulbaghiae]SCE82423.1 Phospholipase_D-nuclease N-terminal [Micromonospora tulbaghiae]